MTFISVIISYLNAKASFVCIFVASLILRKSIVVVVVFFGTFTMFRSGFDDCHSAVRMSNGL